MRARVQKLTGSTWHGVAVKNAGVLDIATLPAAAYVEILEQPSSFLLIRQSESGEFAGDTWHATLEDAKAQAAFEYEVREEDWDASL